MKETYSLLRSATERMPSAQSQLAAPPTAAPTGWWERITSRVRGWFEIPFGYEDENGFHYGHEPRPATQTGSFTSESRHVFTDRASATIQFATELTARPETAPAEERRVPA